MRWALEMIRHESRHIKLRVLYEQKNRKDYLLTVSNFNTIHSETKRKPPALSNTAKSQARGKKNTSVVHLVRTLKDVDFNENLTPPSMNKFLFLSEDAQHSFLTSEQQRNMFESSSRVEVKDKAHRSKIRPDSALTFVSHYLSTNPSNERFEHMKSIHDEGVPPEKKLKHIESFCKIVLSSYYQKGLLLEDLQKVIDSRITGMALARMVYGRKSLQYTHQVIELASAYVKIRAFEQAIPHLRKALSIITDYLNDSKETYDSISLFYSTTNTSKVEVMMLEGKKLLPVLLTSLGKAYLEVGIISNASMCLQEAHRQHKMIFSDEKERSEESGFEYEILMSLSELYIMLEKFERAIQCLENAWEIKESLIGNEKHEDIARVYREMGSVYWKMRRFEESIESFSRARSIYNALPGDINAVNGCIVNYFLGMVHSSSGNIDKALCEFEVSLKGVEKFFGPIHKKTLKVYCKLADLAFERARAKIAHENSHKLRCNLSNEEENGNENGELEQEQDRESGETCLQKVIYLYRDILRRQTKLYGADSEPTALTYEILGDAYMMNEDPLNASLVYKKALQVIEDLIDLENNKKAEILQKYTEAVEALKLGEVDFLCNE